jgi:hypothetical protein
VKEVKDVMWTSILLWAVAIALGLMWLMRRNANRRNAKH